MVIIKIVIIFRTSWKSEIVIADEYFGRASSDHADLEFNGRQSPHHNPRNALLDNSVKVSRQRKVNYHVTVTGVGNSFDNRRR